MTIQAGANQKFPQIDSGPLEAQTQIPVVAVYNNLETFYHFLSRADDPSLFEKRKYRGDRGLYWMGNSKLLFVTADIPDVSYLCEHWGYRDTLVMAPRQSTHQLSLDILREPGLIRQIVEYAGPKKAINLIPYATTAEIYQLVETLRTEYGLTVFLPESPASEHLWLRDYIDSKVGFRTLVSRWVDAQELLTEAVVCRDLPQAADAVHWFASRGKDCVVKADRGESGIGHLVFSADTITSDVVKQKLLQDPFLKEDLIVVEEYISSAVQLSPSLELFVPPLGRGEPEITYLSKQLFERFGRFAGVLISRELLRSDWYATLAENGLKIARQLQALGYVGHFDLDAVVGDDGKIYLLEINTRRTGGTYVHEFARFTFGSDYLERVTLLCNNSIHCGDIRDIQTLAAVLGDLLYPGGSCNTGIVITVVSTLSAGEFGCIFIAPTESEVLSLKQTLLDRIDSYCNKKIGS